MFSLYIIKRFRRRRRVKNREGGERRGGGGGGGGGGRGVPPRPDYSKSPQGLIILSPRRAGLL